MFSPCSVRPPVTHLARPRGHRARGIQAVAVGDGHCLESIAAMAVLLCHPVSVSFLVLYLGRSPALLDKTQLK